MSSTRPSLVLIPQHFGSLVFERRTSRYLPFDHEATELLMRLHHEGIDAVLGSVDDLEEREAVFLFIRCFEDRGFFTRRGRLDAEMRAVDVPADHLVGPLATHVEIIAACNLACSHCFAGELPRNQNPLSVREMDTLFGDLAAVGSMRLGLTGGEPLMRKDVFDILDSATSHGLHPCLTTNGLLVTEETARELGKRNLVWLNVSLDGPDRETNDAVRGAGVFDGVIEKLKLLGRHTRFTLAFTLMKTNVHLVKRCAELARQVGAHTAVFRPMYPAGTGLHHLDLMPTFRQYTNALAELRTLDLPGNDLHGLDVFSPETRTATEPQIHRSQTCGAGQHVCSVSVQGDVNPCSFLGNTFNSGNIRETPFPDIWRHSQTMHRMRQALPEDGFQGGCRARSLVMAGSVDAADPWYDEHRSDGGCHHPGDNLEMHGRVALPMV
ncbi:radical SAM protein [Zavarzinella formosa]|uniref:radical SAM protein n=1 Tax=Zavarzinella formosa TaxID=360055 RepID=UPI0002E81ED7|nr:radical SAM protein [Zavarzinella formosa]